MERIKGGFYYNHLMTIGTETVEVPFFISYIFHAKDGVIQKGELEAELDNTTLYASYPALALYRRILLNVDIFRQEIAQKIKSSTYREIEEHVASQGYRFQ